MKLFICYATRYFVYMMAPCCFVAPSTWQSDCLFLDKEQSQVLQWSRSWDVCKCKLRGPWHCVLWLIQATTVEESAASTFRRWQWRKHVSLRVCMKLCGLTSQKIGIFVIIRGCHTSWNRLCLVKKCNFVGKFQCCVQDTLDWCML